MRILVVDDDELLAHTLVHELTAQHYAVDVAKDGEAGWDYAQATTYDLIVLDVNLPRLDGISLCRRLRQHEHREPVLLLTAKAEADHKVTGLDAGADDYVVKPCSIQELCARIRALLRRQNPSGNPVLTWGDLCLDPSTCEVIYQGQPVVLSAKEYSLLELFLRHPHRVFSSGAILDHLWAFDDLPGEDTVRAHIKRLRRKLKVAGAEEVIETVYGIGYRLKELPASPTDPAILPPVVPSGSPIVQMPKEPTVATLPSSASARQAQAAATAAWDHLKGYAFERLDILHQAIAAFKTHTCAEDLRLQAEQAAHKLAGSLGMFGFARASQVAREIETHLQHPLEQWQVRYLDDQVASLQQQISQPPPTTHPSLTPEASAPDQRSPLATSSDSPTVVLMVDDDLLFTKQLQEAGKSHGVQIDIAEDLMTARLKLVQSLPDVVVVDLEFAGDRHEGLLLLDELSSRYPSVPALILTAHDKLSDRLEISRRSDCMVLSKALPLAQIFEAIQGALKTDMLKQVKVLAVDDDPLVLEALERSLTSHGTKLMTLQNPQDFWKTLTETLPNMLILDVDMPILNGIELCRIVRHDQTWHQLPILFLTSHQDVQTIQQIFAAGADDYVPKPFTETDLVTRIRNRLRRTRPSS